MMMWAGCGSVSALPPDASVDAAVDAPVQRALSVNVEGNGTVTSQPAGIDCGATCTTNFNDATVVTLTATPDTGNVFVGWGGVCSGTADCMTTMTEAREVTAQFACPTGSITFEYTGTVQTLVRPACATMLNVDISGAAGGTARFDAAISGPGGRGGRVQTTLQIQGTDIIYITVGGQGAAPPVDAGGAGGYNGGGTGGVATTQRGGGGGGASDLRKNGMALADRVVVAAGGAGGASCGGAPLDGGPGGGLTGGVPTINCSQTQPGGGTQTAGGSGGNYPNWCSADSGTAGIGGNGCSPSGAGGGGGGWFGGGGGAWTGGGGGSSYTTPTATNVIHTPAYRDGNGVVTISW